MAQGGSVTGGSTWTSLDGAAPRHLYLSGPWSRKVGEWDSLLAREVHFRRARFPSWVRSGKAGWEVESIHVGGEGARAPLPGELRRLLAEGALEPAPGAEVALEVAPQEVQTDRVGGWIRAGVTRLSLRTPVQGVPGDWPRTRHLDRLVSWGVDLAFGHSEGAGDVLELLEAVILRWTPPQVSLVEVAAGAPGGRSQVAGEGTNGADQDHLADLYLELTRRLELAGYRQWSFTAFALPGREPVHQQAVLRGEPYLGLGPGAHSHLPGRRFWNLDDPGAYTSRLGLDQDPAAGEDRPTTAQRLLETLWRSLSLAGGLDLRASGLHHPRSLRDRWVSAGYARPCPGRLRLTPSGWLVLDSLVLELADAWPRVGEQAAVLMNGE